MNTFTALEAWFDQANHSMAKMSDDADAAKTRADAAEQELEEAKRQVVAEANRAQVAERRANVALTAACGFENRISSLLKEMELQGNQVSEAEKKASEAEAKVIEAERKTSEAEAKAAECERKVTEAEAKAAETIKIVTEAVEKQVTEAVATFRQSAAFNAEIVKGTAYAFNLGFRECRRKMKDIFQIEGMESVEPDEVLASPSSSSVDSAPPPEA